MNKNTIEYNVPKEIKISNKLTQFVISQKISIYFSFGKLIVMIVDGKKYYTSQPNDKPMATHIGKINAQYKLPSSEMTDQELFKLYEKCVIKKID